MANSITQQRIESSRRHLYVIWWLVVVVSLVLYLWTFIANIVLDNIITDKQDTLTEVQNKVKALGSEKSFFSYNFAKKITSWWSIKRSDHIRSLIEVLNQIQSNNYVGANAIKLSDFTITPKTISLKGKVSNLILLYYSSQEKNYTSVIDRFTNLPFIANVTIKKYTKVGDYYEFVLTADIDLNAAIQSTTTNLSGSAISGSNQ